MQRRAPGAPPVPTWSEGAIAGDALDEQHADPAITQGDEPGAQGAPDHAGRHQPRAGGGDTRLGGVADRYHLAELEATSESCSPLANGEESCRSTGVFAYSRDGTYSVSVSLNRFVRHADGAITSVSSERGSTAGDASRSPLTVTRSGSAWLRPTTVTLRSCAASGSCEGATRAVTVSGRYKPYAPVEKDGGRSETVDGKCTVHFKGAATSAYVEGTTTIGDLRVTQRADAELLVGLTRTRCS